MQQFQQMEQEGTSGLLLQPVSTGFVRFLLLLSRWPWVRGSCAPPRAFRRSLAAALKDIRVERFSVSWLASGKRAAAAGQEEGEDDGEKTQTKKLYVGHLGSMYTTVWGGAFSGRLTLTPEILFWLRQLGPFQPLRLAADLSPRSHERKAARAAIDQKRHSLLQGEDRSGLYYALPGFAESDVTLGGEGENKRKNEKTLSVSAYSASLLAGDGDGMQVHTDADSTESESEAQFRQALAAARKRQPGGCVSHSSAAASGRGRLPRLEKDAASGGRGASQDLDLAKGFAYLGGGFTHLNTSWSYVPPKRRLTFLPSAGLHADSCRAEKQDEESKGGKESRKRHSVALNQGDAEAGARSAKVDGDGTEDGACSGVASSAWVVENSSSDESVRAFISDDAVYRRRFRSWRKRQRKAGGRVFLLSRSVRAAESAAALGTGSGDSPVDDAWQGHILDEFLRRMGSGMSLSRYTQLANAAAAGASTLASASRRKFGTRSRKRPLSAADASKFSPESLISSEQASAMHDLKHLQPRPVWGGTGASFAGSPESSVFSLVSEPKKICRLRRKPRVRAVEPAWDLQSPSASLNALERGRAANGGSSRAVDSKHAPEFPFGMVAKGVWGGSPGAHAGSSTLKGREVQLICVDESEVHKRLGKTKLYQQVLHGMEDKLMARREFYVVVDEQSRELRVVPAGRLVFFLTETPRQRQEQFLSRLFADLRRRSRGTFLQSLLTKRRNARNILLMNAMIWQNQLKHVNKARLCLLLGGYWRDAAFAAANGSLTEQQLLQDFLSVNGAWLSDLVEKSAGASGESSGNHQGSKQNSARRLIEAISRRWSVEDRSRRSATEEGSWQAFQRDTPAVKAAAASMHLPPAVLEKIDEAAEDAAVVARAAVTAADRRTKEIVKRNLLPGLLLRYIQRIFPLFVRVYLTARCTFALQRREEQSFTRRMRQVENTGAKGGGAAAASAAGGFSANVLRGQYDVFTAGVSSTSPMGDLEKAEAGTTMESRLKAMLPPFNASATSPVELFDVGNLLPLHLVQIAEEGSSSFSASPFVLLVKGGSRASQVDVVAMEESWGRFAVDYARHVGQERRNRQGEGNGGPLLSTLSVDDCARLTKVLRALVVLYSRQNKTFFGAKGLGNALRVYLGRASDDTAGPNFDVLPLPVSQWIARTFLQQDEQEQLFLSQEKKTKLLATVLWLCVASSSNWTFDFEGLLVHEWNGRYGGHFEGCASLIGLKRTGNDSKPREYRLELPCPLTTGEAIEASQRAQIVAPIHSLLGHDKKKRSTR
ncbi:hypothetical protein BESB_012650 [Besnoitia besnoiti]|uniref:Uncharacterized protein n=1 Tax=Besnoitia besnoiti TaxID=94643 RepID=A0A2A9MAD7_BESBE|nr:hypothetical protein BESB_012650 [Besnoitia besnoiti]PFH32653.1 hypothetical protein BESB_012650 [Besnoitia besnoiti]